MEKKFNNLLKRIKKYNKKADLKKIRNAWKFAKLAHADQKRLSGEPFAAHCLEVMKILVHWKLDTESIIAGLLHDTIEDGGATRQDIVQEFGEEVAELVDGVTKVTGVRLRGSREKVFAESLRKMILVMARDLRVVFIKLADRTHNMRTLSALPRKKQIANAKETLEIYAPLAERLGIGEAKGELEDLAFPCLYPKSYKKVVKEASVKYLKAEKDLKNMKRNLAKLLKEEKMDAEIHGRRKHLYSLWRKLERSDKNWDEINDIVALRIIVNSVPDCYVTLGLVHAAYKPVPKIGVSDFIAQPKPNGYQSIHTKVFNKEGRIVEIQIRTHTMHEQAEHGMAAHWSYKEGNVLAGKLNWVKSLVEWQKELVDSKEFYESVKIDAFQHRNFVFSPEGDVYDLPRHSTPVDFAYAVHTDLGSYIKGAKVNGRIVSLNHRLVSGDLCEIIKSKNKKLPNKDWLDFVVTTSARRNIKKELRKSLKDSRI